MFVLYYCLCSTSLMPFSLALLLCSPIFKYFECAHIRNFLRKKIKTTKKIHKHRNVIIPYKKSLSEKEKTFLLASKRIGNFLIQKIK